MSERIMGGRVQTRLSRVKAVANGAGRNARKGWFPTSRAACSRWYASTNRDPRISGNARSL